ncbi:unnamed protein product [Moneuplotes crassus]|uniref:Uncharacterized protein n=1 Tax=Euplotes crassus TaxID=5936 RepID=A0AAD1XLE0_EUPCR|nr:unnamed protein product [Moneuplotes crassus]
MSSQPRTTRRSKNKNKNFKFPPISKKKGMRKNNTNKTVLHEETKQSSQQTKKFRKGNKLLNKRLGESQSKKSDEMSNGSLLKDFFAKKKSMGVKNTREANNTLSYGSEVNTSRFLLKKREKEAKEREWVNSIGQKRFKNNEVLKNIFSKNYEVEGMKNRYKSVDSRGNKSVSNPVHIRNKFKIDNHESVREMSKPLVLSNDYLEPVVKQADTLSNFSIHSHNQTPETVESSAKGFPIYLSKGRENNQRSLLNSQRRYESLKLKNHDKSFPMNEYGIINHMSLKSNRHNHPKIPQNTS